MDENEEIPFMFWLPLAFVLGCMIGIITSTPSRPVPPADECRPPHGYVTRLAAHREQTAVVSQWRRWTETAAANGECRGRVLHGEEP